MQSHAQAQGQYQQFYTNGAGGPENGAQHGYIPIYTHHQHTHQPPHSQALPHGAYPSSLTSNTSGGPSSPMTEAEADLKRLRNTAASARFRAKKKQREASLERNSREKKEQLAKLEGRIHELEEENKFLKDLIMEKNDSREDLERLKGRYDVAGRKREEGDARKDGVGT
jgi:TolA-binding protein